MNAEKEALFQRLVAFVGKLDAKQEELFAEARSSFVELIAAQPGEIALVKTVLGDLRGRNEEIVTNLRLTWDQQISEKFQALDDDAFEERGHEYYDATVTRLEEAFAAFEASIAADAFRAAWPLVEAAMQRPRSCPNCGGGVTLTNPSQAETITCPYCGAQNQIYPDTLVGYYHAGIAYALSAERDTAARLAEAELRARRG